MSARDLSWRKHLGDGTRRHVSVEESLDALAAHLPTGRDAAIPASELAGQLGVSERTVGALTAELIDRGWLIGSICSGDRPGYFICRDLEDVRLGTAHILARAFQSLRRVNALKANARERFGDAGERLFDIEEYAGA